MSSTRFGVVALLGAPNVGKSTLVNALVGHKVAIVAPKAQTTRARLRGIVCRGSTQIVLVDTPGIFSPRRRLDRAMTRAAWRGSRDADLRCVLIDATRGVDQEASRILDGLGRARTGTIPTINKVDQVRKETLLPMVALLRDRWMAETVLLVSALRGEGLDDLAREVAERCPEGPWHYPGDQTSDVTLRQLAAEFVREQVYLQLHQELPYDTTTETVSWKDLPDGSVRVDVAILVRRESQKPIVVGRGGQRIRSIGSAARASLAVLAGTDVHLFVHVRVEPGWQDRKEHYDALGLDFPA